MDFIKDETTKKRAIRILILIAIIIVVVAVLGFLFNVILPTLVGTVLVICVVAFVAHKIYVKKRQSMSPDVEAGRT